MTLEQIEKIAESVPPFRHLLLTGGEPTLRKDLVEVIGAFASRGKIQTAFINSNGLKPSLIEEIATAVKTRHPHLGLEFQISIDGLEATHDRVRGVPGNFQKAMETLRTVLALRGKFQHLGAHALTVIMESNYEELVPLNDYLRSTSRRSCCTGSSWCATWSGRRGRSRRRWRRRAWGRRR